MSFQWCQLFTAVLLHNAILFSKSTSSVEESPSTKVVSTDNEGLDDDDESNGRNGEDSKEVSLSNEEEDSMKTEAMYRDDSYGYSRRPCNRGGRYRYYGNVPMNGLRRWRDFKYGQCYDVFNGVDQPWPRQENRWDTPQEDEWNFGSPVGGQCNIISQSGIPDQPWRWSDQAYEITNWEYVKFKDLNVSSYDIYQERCCDGKTYPKYPNGRNSCCGSFDYDTTQEVCCDEKLFSPQQGHECCGEEYINIDTNICCYHPTNGPVVKPLPEGDMDAKEKSLFSQCCGNEIYDTRSHVCFLVTRYSQLASFVVIEKQYNRTGCCEGKPYDQDTENCTETSRTYTFLSGPPCVFRQAYEQVRKWRGYHGTPQNRPYSRSQFLPQYLHSFEDRGYGILLSRCRDKMYDPIYQKCCGDQDYEKENGSVKVWTAFSNSSCCGTEIYRYNTHRCCNGRIVEKLKNGHDYVQMCCGEELYNYYKQRCCEGSNTVIDAAQIHWGSCCGVEALVFNSSTHVCCNGRLVAIPEEQKNTYRYPYWRCCSSYDAKLSDQVYDVNTAKCCNGVVYNVSYEESWTYQCCGNELYNRYISVCCGGKIYNATGCCLNKEAYNSSTHTCCDGTVVEKPSNDAHFCCGKTAYDNHLKTCCFDSHTNEPKLTYKRSRRERCCGGTPYDPDKKSCCGASLIIIEDAKKSLCCPWYDPENGNYSIAVVPKKANANSSSCCGHSAYDKKSEICCHGNVLSDVYKNMTCCGRLAYDKKDEICCNGNVISDVKKKMTCCGSNGYNAGSQLCCYGEVHERSYDGKRKCCGKNMYDVTKEICCRGVALLVNDVNTAMCCYEKPQK